MRQLVIRMAALLVLGAPAAVFGQVGPATLTGIVRDETQAAIVNAPVKVTNTEPGFTVTLVTNETGVRAQVAGRRWPGISTSTTCRAGPLTRW